MTLHSLVVLLIVQTISSHKLYLFIVFTFPTQDGAYVKKHRFSKTENHLDKKEGNKMKGRESDEIIILGNN